MKRMFKTLSSLLLTIALLLTPQFSTISFVAEERYNKENISILLQPEEFNFIYEIIVNSVDIFKILFIIMLSGITYISNIISDFGIILSGIFYGISICICISDVVSSSLYSNRCFTVAVLISKIIMLSLLVIYSCVTSTKFSEDINSYNDSFLVIKSDVFMKYLFRILVILGCVIILEVTFRFIFKFLI